MGWPRAELRALGAQRIPLVSWLSPGTPDDVLRGGSGTHRLSSFWEMTCRKLKFRNLSVQSPPGHDSSHGCSWSHWAYGAHAGKANGRFGAPRLQGTAGSTGEQSMGDA